MVNDRSKTKSDGIPDSEPLRNNGDQYVQSQLLPSSSQSQNVPQSNTSGSLNPSSSSSPSRSVYLDSNLELDGNGLTLYSGSTSRPASGTETPVFEDSIENSRHTQASGSTVPATVEHERLGTVIPSDNVLEQPNEYSNTNDNINNNSKDNNKPGLNPPNTTNAYSNYTKVRPSAFAFASMKPESSFLSHTTPNNNTNNYSSISLSPSFSSSSSNSNFSASSNSPGQLPIHPRLSNAQPTNTNASLNTFVTAPLHSLKTNTISNALSNTTSHDQQQRQQSPFYRSRRISIENAGFTMSMRPTRSSYLSTNSISDSNSNRNVARNRRRSSIATRNSSIVPKTTFESFAHSTGALQKTYTNFEVDGGTSGGGRRRSSVLKRFGQLKQNNNSGSLFLTKSQNINTSNSNTNTNSNTNHISFPNEGLLQVPYDNKRNSVPWSEATSVIEVTDLNANNHTQYQPNNSSTHGWPSATEDTRTKQKFKKKHSRLLKKSHLESIHNWLYRTSFLFLMLCFSAVVAAMPIDMIIQSQKTGQFWNAIIIIAAYALLAMIAGIITIFRIISTNRSLAAIPHNYTPGLADVPIELYKNIQSELQRCRDIARKARPIFRNPPLRISHDGLMPPSVKQRGRLADTTYIEVIKLASETIVNKAQVLHPYLDRSPGMSLLSYVYMLFHHGVIATSEDVVKKFVEQFECARYSGKLVTEAQFAQFMESCHKILVSMRINVDRSQLEYMPVVSRQPSARQYTNVGVGLHPQLSRRSSYLDPTAITQQNGLGLNINGNNIQKEMYSNIPLLPLPPADITRKDSVQASYSSTPMSQTSTTGSVVYTAPAFNSLNNYDLPPSLKTFDNYGATAGAALVRENEKPTEKEHELVFKNPWSSNGQQNTLSAAYHPSTLTTNYTNFNSGIISGTPSSTHLAVDPPLRNRSIATMHSFGNYFVGHNGEYDTYNNDSNTNNANRINHNNDSNMLWNPVYESSPQEFISSMTDLTRERLARRAAASNAKSAHSLRSTQSTHGLQSTHSTHGLRSTNSLNSPHALNSTHSLHSNVSADSTGSKIIHKVPSIPVSNNSGNQAQYQAQTFLEPPPQQTQHFQHLQQYSNEPSAVIQSQNPKLKVVDNQNNLHFQNLKEREQIVELQQMQQQLKNFTNSNMMTTMTSEFGQSTHEDRIPEGRVVEDGINEGATGSESHSKKHLRHTLHIPYLHNHHAPRRRSSASSVIIHPSPNDEPWHESKQEMDMLQRSNSRPGETLAVSPKITVTSTAPGPRRSSVSSTSFYSSGPQQYQHYNQKEVPSSTSNIDISSTVPISLNRSSSFSFAHPSVEVTALPNKSQALVAAAAAAKYSTVFKTASELVPKDSFFQTRPFHGHGSQQQFGKGEDPALAGNDPSTLISSASLPNSYGYQLQKSVSNLDSEHSVSNPVLTAALADSLKKSPRLSRTRTRSTNASGNDDDAEWKKQTSLEEKSLIASGSPGVAANTLTRNNSFIPIARQFGSHASHASHNSNASYNSHISPTSRTSPVPYDSYSGNNNQGSRIQFDSSIYPEEVHNVHNSSVSRRSNSFETGTSAVVPGLMLHRKLTSNSINSNNSWESGGRRFGRGPGSNNNNDIQAGEFPETLQRYNTSVNRAISGEGYNVQSNLDCEYSF